MDSSKKKMSSKIKSDLKINTPKSLNGSDKKIPSPSNLMKHGIMNVYTNRVSILSPHFDGFDCVDEFHNLYTQKKKEIVFDSAISRIESVQDNMFGSANLENFIEENLDKSSALRVMPCFPGAKVSPKSKSKNPIINDLKVI